ncbi:peptide chain release factor N(5)-glutamine methyltransferase [Ferviditalea candida]|uniref:Release factor glutamine methyltransferase n=1 Tax=Ferviditalea candida TaxID=3108399 RepID=A0ABU5ZJ68_9BACL|nr:peptide chain release factor N(5)-glutamine methyltransferase [Paenibacillaceae bacterium T2]
MTRPTLSIREACLRASSLLAERGVEDSRQAAEWLLLHLLRSDRTRLFLHWEEPFPAELAPLWEEAVRRRAQGEPVQYITGEQEFYGLAFRVNPSVLIPRPETELLVEAVIRIGRELWPEPGDSPLLLDIGTGSGAIPVSIAVQCPGWRICAVDISPAALDTARSNAADNGVAERITFLPGDLLLPAAEAGVDADILVSNPPYIPSSDIPGLQREVRDHEPVLALDGGEDGLSFYRRIIGQMELLPHIPQCVGFEVGFGQADAVVQLLRETGRWEEIRVIKDLAGIQRHVLAVRR